MIFYGSRRHNAIEAVAYSPGHITGFFQILDQEPNPLQKGSRGAGISIKKGTTTKVRIEKASKTSFKIRINGEAKSAKVSEAVLQAFLASVDNESYHISVSHEVDIPVGYGLGSSGSGALSLALALNNAFSLGLSNIEAAQIAHVAEVKCKTGLGTVIAETFGGFEVRVKAGAPGVGEVRQIPIQDDYRVVCLNFGHLSTRRFLSDKKFRRRINELGGKYVDKLISQPSTHDFMQLSRSFAEHVGLISERIWRVLKETDESDIACSMPIFGESVFTLTKEDEVEKVVKIFRRHAQSEKSIMVSDIDFKGARLLQ